MTGRAYIHSPRRTERGYALLLVAFVATLMLLAAVAAAPNILTNGKREKEEEMIWRGKQYVRGIKLYYRKMGKFPTSLEDLTKPKMGNIRFMRQEYKDPMNKEDGSWRLIYVGPSGQLLGSLKPQPNLQLPAAIPGTSQIGTPAAAMNGTFGSQTGGGQPAQGLGGTMRAAPPSEGTVPEGEAPVSTDTDSSGNPAPASSMDTSTIIGGNIIGVGSKINGRSVIVYEKAKNYRLFEFYWDPAKDSITIGAQPGVPPGGVLGGNPTVPPIGAPNPQGGTAPSGPPQQQNPPAQN